MDWMLVCFCQFLFNFNHSAVSNSLCNMMEYEQRGLGLGPHLAHRAAGWQQRPAQQQDAAQQQQAQMKQWIVRIIFVIFLLYLLEFI
jgi:hypothetical protein